MNDLNSVITIFEKEQLKTNQKIQNMGVVYTPLALTNFMVNKAFKIYWDNFNDNLKNSTQNGNQIIIQEKLPKNERKTLIHREVIKNMKILDPSCGSGRFLISIADYLYRILKLYSKETSYNIKKRIIEHNIYGNDLELNACLISKVRLINWLNSKDISVENQFVHNGVIDFNSLEELIEDTKLKLNIHNDDYLLHFNPQIFDLIIGNPPYVENKKIKNLEYKKVISRKFQSAYKLYDLSTLFIERSLQLLKMNYGVLTFLTPNKFLASDSGIKVRELLLDQTQIKELINISHLDVFKRVSAYPIILYLIRKPKVSTKISIREVENLNDLKNQSSKKSFKLDQKSFRNLPSKVISLSRDVKTIARFYSKFEQFSNAFKDLKILYRPFGFINWAQNSKYIVDKPSSNKDLILLGTGNINKYYINFKKPLKVGKKKYFNAYFQYNSSYQQIWDKLSKEKLIFREIAKELSFIYDPGIFVNLTGLYFITIPSLNSNELLSLLGILNSTLINSVFIGLFGTLHMSNGYLRINGSFIKRLPIPTSFPNSLSQLTKIIQFLNQLKYEMHQNFNFSLKMTINISELMNNICFYNKLNNLIVDQLYKGSIKNQTSDFSLKIDEYLPEIEIKYFYPYYELSCYKLYNNDEILHNLQMINSSRLILKSFLK